MSSNAEGNAARTVELRTVINRRRFLVLCGGAAATLVLTACGDKDAEPEVERVEVPQGQLPGQGAEPLHIQEGRFYLINDDQEGLMALYTRCTHQGCTVEWKSDQQGFACPCHGSKFDRRGIRTDGPADRPLDLMAVEVQSNGSVLIDTTDITKRSQ